MHMNSITTRNIAEELCSHAYVAVRSGRRLSRTSSNMLIVVERAGVSSAGATPLNVYRVSGVECSQTRKSWKYAGIINRGRNESIHFQARAGGCRGADYSPALDVATSLTL
jgi:hypothetical protein